MAEEIKDEIACWEIIERRVVYSDHQITVNSHIYRTTWGVIVDDYPTMEFRDWAAVIALTPDFEIVLIRTYRPGAHRIFTEPPGGRIDEGEDPAAAAARELKEETGYEADPLIPLPVVMAAPGRYATCAYGYLAFNAKPVADRALESGEELELLTMPFADYLAEMTNGAEPVNACHLAMMQCAANHILQMRDKPLEPLRESIRRVFAGQP